MAQSLENILITDMTLHWSMRDEQSEHEEEAQITSYDFTQVVEDQTTKGEDQITKVEEVYSEISLIRTHPLLVSQIDTVGEEAPTPALGENFTPCLGESLLLGSSLPPTPLWIHQNAVEETLRSDWIISSEEVYNYTNVYLKDEEKECDEEEYDETDENCDEPSLLPIKGTFVHPNILTGFMYLVQNEDTERLMFQGKALHLLSIGRGYGKRITFESDSAIHNDNFFYSDTNCNGYSLKLVTVDVEDQFTVHDESDEAVAFFKVDKIESQNEVRQTVHSGQKVEKILRVAIVGTLDSFKTGFEENVTITGNVSLVRQNGRALAILKKITRCVINGASEKSYILFPGCSPKVRTTYITSNSPGEFTTSYKIKGLLPHELPVIGTYVHPNIIIGAKYRVRSLRTGKFLFEGDALKLQSIGRGYGKRITFQNKHSLLENDNYFYSDTDEDGWGFTIEAISVGDTFRILGRNDEKDVGVAEVFRTDVSQHQHPGTDKTKAHVTVTVSCHFDIKGSESHSTTLVGEALIKKNRHSMEVIGVTDLKFGGLFEIFSGHMFHLIPL